MAKKDIDALGQLNSSDDSEGIQIENGLRRNLSNKLLHYDPTVDGSAETEPVQRRHPHPSSSQNSAPSDRSIIRTPVWKLAAQCATCFKWRLIPTMEKYEAIREHITEHPFHCETAREWRPDITCNDPEDILQDGSSSWAYDIHNIAQTPPGWQRLVQVRGDQSTRFADVYYVAPTGKRLRSKVEIQRYLNEHPKYRTEVSPSQFSFQIPVPVQESQVNKLDIHAPALQDPKIVAEDSGVCAISSGGQGYGTDSQLRRPESHSPVIYIDDSDSDSLGSPVKKQASKAQTEEKDKNVVSSRKAKKEASSEKDKNVVSSRKAKKEASSEEESE